jgi:hypothetical protein
MHFDIPEAMRTEHDALHADLVRLTRAGGRTGDAAKAVAEVLHPHFVKENEYALPPLGLLVPLSQGRFDPQMADVLPLTDRLAADLPEMLAEHAQVRAAVAALEEAATAEHHVDALAFAHTLALHARMEEQVTYPTALLVGRYVKSALGKIGS